MGNVCIKAHTLIIDQLDSHVVLGPETAMHSFRSVKLMGTLDSELVHELMCGDVSHILVDGVGYGSIQSATNNAGVLTITYDTLVYLGSSKGME